MEVVTHTIEYNRPDVFYLYPFFDAHLGSTECSEKSLVHKVKECASLGRFGLAVGGGDWLDCITKRDPRFNSNGLADWVEKGNIVNSQRRRAKEIFSPLAEQKQLIQIGTGNHEEEIHSRHDDDVIREICDHDLHVPYGGYQSFVVLKFIRAGMHNHNLIIHSWHGAGAAQSEGARVLRLMRLVNEIQADIYLMGHLHAMTSYTLERLFLTLGKIRSVKLSATICGAWIKTYNQPDENKIQDPTYGEKKGYKPAYIGCPIIRITPDLYGDPHGGEVVIES